MASQSSFLAPRACRNITNKLPSTGSSRTSKVSNCNTSLLTESDLSKMSNVVIENMTQLSISTTQTVQKATTDVKDQLQVHIETVMEAVTAKIQKKIEDLKERIEKKLDEVDEKIGLMVADIRLLTLNQPQGELLASHVNDEARLEKQVEEFNTKVEDILTAVRIIRVELPKAGVSTESSNDEEQSQVSMKVPSPYEETFVTVDVDGVNHRFEITKPQKDLLRGCSKPRQAVNLCLRILYPVRELQKFTLTGKNTRLQDDNNDSISDEDDEGETMEGTNGDDQDGSALQNALRKQLPAATVAIIQAVNKKLFPIPPALQLTNPVDFITLQTTKEQDVRGHIGKILQYYRSSYDSDGKVIRKSPSQINKPIKRLLKIRPRNLKPLDG